jgi:hypothetical protein
MTGDLAAMLRTRFVVLGQLALVGLGFGCRSSDGPEPTPASAGSAGQAGDAPSTSGGGGAGGTAIAMGGASGSAAGGAATVPASAALALGPFSSCVVGADQMVKCAGRCGPMGKGGSREQAPAGVSAKSVVVGRAFACALLTAPQAGSLVQCWGAGPGAEAPSIADAVELAAGDEHACARSGQGAVTCWGDAAHAAPTDLVAKALAASGAMTCAIAADDAVRCWGHRPAEPPADLRASQLAVSSQLTDPKLGPRFACAVTLAGDVSCFGDDPGQVQMVPAGLKAKAIATGRSNACAIALDDTVSCWGLAPRYGAPMPAGLKASRLALSFRSAAAVGLDGKLSFWGDTGDGRSNL